MSFHPPCAAYQRFRKNRKLNANLLGFNENLQDKEGISDVVLEEQAGSAGWRILARARELLI